MKYLILSVFYIVIAGCSSGKNNNSIVMESKKGVRKVEKIIKTKDEWKNVLSDNQFYIMIEKGTEKPFTGEYWDVYEDGIYKCAACGFELFKSDTKFDAHCGWPSFYDSVDKTRIKTEDDYKLGYKRTEIMCAKCGVHLGHVFSDGPNPTGLRYCVNSASIKLDTKK
jgi:peptide-methionine (R)-S-oxide reductase